MDGGGKPVILDGGNKVRVLLVDGMHLTLKGVTIIFGAKHTLRKLKPINRHHVALKTSFSRDFSGKRGISSVIVTGEKSFHFLGRSAERSLQAALSLSVCLAPNIMVTPSK